MAWGYLSELVIPELEFPERYYRPPLPWCAMHPADKGIPPRDANDVSLINASLPVELLDMIFTNTYWASGAKVFQSRSATLSSTIAVQGAGGSVTLLAVTSSTFIQIAVGESIAPSTSPDVVYS